MVLRSWTLERGARCSIQQRNLLLNDLKRLKCYKTTIYYKAEHGEDGNNGEVSYNTSNDLAQSTGVQILASNVGADNDQSCSGELCILNPASTTFATCFYATTNSARSDNITFNIYVDGYCSAAAAIDGVQFSFASGAIASGTFKLYGVA